MQKNDANTKFYLHILNFIRTFVLDFKNEVFSMKKEFIKVTPKGGKKSFIVPAAIEAFYRSQKATIERPTDDEIAAERPEVRAQYKAAKRAKAITDEVNALRKENADLKALINALKAGKPSKKAK